MNPSSRSAANVPRRMVGAAVQRARTTVHEIPASNQESVKSGGPGTVGKFEPVRNAAHEVLHEPGIRVDRFPGQALGSLDVVMRAPPSRGSLPPCGDRCFGAL